MNNEAEAADLILRIVINGTAYFFKLASTIAEPVRKLVADAIYRGLHKAGANVTNPQMKALIERGEGLSVFQLPEREMETFRKAMKPMGVKYVEVESQEETAEDRITMIICSGGDTQAVNAILTQNRLHGRSLATAEKNAPAPIEKPETPSESVTAEQSAENAKEQDAAFKQYYVTKEDTAAKHPTQTAERTAESPSVTGSTTTGHDSSSELDIENLPSEIEYEKAQKKIRFSVRDRLGEIKDDMKKSAQAPAATAAKSPVLESIEQQLKSQAGKVPQIGE